jgi:hypothetical protein
VIVNLSEKELHVIIDALTSSRWRAEGEADRPTSPAHGDQAWEEAKVLSALQTRLLIERQEAAGRPKPATPLTWETGMVMVNALSAVGIPVPPEWATWGRARWHSYLKGEQLTIHQGNEPAWAVLKGIEWALKG